MFVAILSNNRLGSEIHYRGGGGKESVQNIYDLFEAELICNLVDAIETTVYGIQ